LALAAGLKSVIFTNQFEAIYCGEKTTGRNHDIGNIKRKEGQKKHPNKINYIPQKNPVVKIARPPKDNEQQPVR